jgi:curved DNA-binding protein CbpA
MNDPWKILGLTPQAAEEEIRAAYLRGVKEHPPERSPEEFERIRDAYESLRDPRRRMHDRIIGVDPLEPLMSVVNANERPRRFVGVQPWLEVLKGK